MNSSKFYLFLVFFLLNCSIIESELRWAFEIFRHGARTPYSGMTKDFKDCFGVQWEGIKELTGVGLRQHFLVGYRNYLRYIKENNLIKEKYDPREVYLISTDSNRTIMSANAQVQGLYLPGTGPTLNEKQSKVAVPPVEGEEIYKEEKDILDENDYTALPNKMNIMPIHNFFTKDHFIQLQDKKVCPGSKKYYDENQKREEVRLFLQEMNEKYGAQLNQTLIEEQRVKDALLDYTRAYYIFDTIIAQYTEGKDEYENIAEILGPDILNDSFKFFDLDLVGNGINHDSELCIYSMSPIFDRILNWTQAKINKDIKGDLNYTEYDLPKFVMFSAHDSTCGAFMGFMKATFGSEIRYPYFATNINLELRKEGNEYQLNNYMVDYFINDELMGSFKYTDFRDKINNIKKSKKEINKFCQFDGEEKTEDDDDDDDDDIYLAVNIVLSIFSVILIVLIFLTIKRKNLGKKNNIDEMDGVDGLLGKNDN